MKETYTIFVHWPCFEGYMDSTICLPIKMPFVPRIGESIFIPREDVAHLESTVNNDASLRVKYKRWLYPDHIVRGRKVCSFDDADTVIDLVWRDKTKEIHIELGACINEKESYADSY